MAIGEWNQKQNPATLTLWILNRKSVNGNNKLLFSKIIIITLWLSFLKLITKNKVYMSHKVWNNKTDLTNQANILNKNITESFIEISKGVGGLLWLLSTKNKQGFLEFWHCKYNFHIKSQPLKPLQHKVVWT